MSTAGVVSGQYTAGNRTVASPSNCAATRVDEAPFPREILLAADRPRELLHEPREAVQRGVGDVVLGEGSHVSQDRQIVLDERGDHGPPHFDGDRFARSKGRAVDLRDRGRRDAASGRIVRRARRTGRPNASSMARSAVPGARGGTESCSSESSATTSGGSRSARVLSAWPNLMKVGPSASSARRRPLRAAAAGDHLMSSDGGEYSTARGEIRRQVQRLHDVDEAVA